MIPVAEALRIITTQTQVLPSHEVPLVDSLGAVLAEDIYAPVNLPPFNNSAMDGYAIIHEDVNTYTLTAESKAGDSEQIHLERGQAARVFTGAAVPENADTVVMQEHVTKNGNEITIDRLPGKYSNIRNAGEQVREGDLVLRKGLTMNAAGIGFLAAMGIDKVKVYSTPKVAILVTGNELQKPGEKLKPGSIYESNSIMLHAALQKAGVSDVEVLTAKDNLAETESKIKYALENADMLLVSGGISVGDYDFVKEALERNEVEELFYKVNQKPGKPLWFGKKDEKMVFALPGNPASGLSCFYIYVLPALRKMKGEKELIKPVKKAKAISEIKNTTGKTLFLKAEEKDGQVKILEGQSSSMLHSFVLGNVLAVIPENVTSVPKGGDVEYISLNS